MTFMYVLKIVFECEYNFIILYVSWMDHHIQGYNHTLINQ